MRLEGAAQAGRPLTASSEPATPRRGEWPLRGLCAACGLGSVLPLLVWAFGGGSFQSWTIALALPSQLALLVSAVVATNRRYPALHTALRAGVVGGIVGTVGYDLVRAPFEAAGLRVFLPIDSYGILMLGERTSTPITDLLGWVYHFTNGIGFGITYACLALGRRWVWALPWALFLETAFIVTPLGGFYSIRGQWLAIAVAYGGHLAYGMPLGVVVEQAGKASARVKVPVPASWALGAVAVALLALHQPFSGSAADSTGRALSTTTASAVLRDGQFHPTWLRTPVGGCALIRNDDSVSQRLVGAARSVTVAPASSASICFDAAGIVRVRVGATPFSGGVGLVDPAEQR